MPHRLKKKKSERHALAGLEESNHLRCELPVVATWQGKVGGLWEWPLANNYQEIGSSDLQLKGSEFCSKPVSLEEDLGAQERNVALADTLISR